MPEGDGGGTFSKKCIGFGNSSNHGAKIIACFIKKVTIWNSKTVYGYW
jgi:hypothetical protein